MLSLTDFLEKRWGFVQHDSKRLRLWMKEIGGSRYSYLAIRMNWKKTEIECLEVCIEHYDYGELGTDIPTLRGDNRERLESFFQGLWEPNDAGIS